MIQNGFWHATFLKRDQGLFWSGLSTFEFTRIRNKVYKTSVFFKASLPKIVKVRIWDGSIDSQKNIVHKTFII